MSTTVPPNSEAVLNMMPTHNFCELPTLSGRDNNGQTLAIG